MRHITNRKARTMVGIATDFVSGVSKLDEMRQIGDPPADAAIEFFQTQRPKGALESLANNLVGFQFAKDIDELIEQFAREPTDYGWQLDPRRRVYDCGFPANDAKAKQEVLDDGQQVFQDHGLKILLILVCYSLPAAYAAQKGVRVLHSDAGSTGYFVKDLNRRLLETTQFVIEVFADDGLAIDPDQPFGVQGPAVKSALRVRLLHAAVRALIEAHLNPKWDGKGLGRPVNQEDLTGTLMTFSWVVLDGLERMRVTLTSEQKQAYYDIWKRVGRLLGVQDIPETVEDAEKRAEEIKVRQVYGPIERQEVNTRGIQMTRNLLLFVNSQFPGPLCKLPLAEALLLFFLPRKPDVPASLGVHRTPLCFILVQTLRLIFVVEAMLTKFRIFHRLNTLIYSGWSRRDPRAFVLLQFSRNIGRRLLRGMKKTNRNETLDVKGRPDFELHGWDQKWRLDLTANPAERARRERAKKEGTYKVSV